MTSRLPVVGKKYREKEKFIESTFGKNSGVTGEAEVNVIGDIIIFTLTQETRSTSGSSFWNKLSLSDFWNRFEELSDSNPQETPKEKIKISSDENYLRIDIENNGTTAFPIGTKIDIFRDSNPQEVEEDCPFETAAEEWNTTKVKEVSEKFYCKTCLNDTSEDMPCRQHSKDICCACHDRKCDERIEDYNKVSEVERALEELKSELKDWFESFPDFFLSKPECNHTWAGKRIGDSCEDCDDKFFSKVRPFCQNGVYYTLRKAQSLIDALEAEKNAIRPEPAKEFNFHKDRFTIGNIDYSEKIYMSKPEPKIDMKEERVEPVSIWKPISQLNKNENNNLLIRNDKKIFFGEHLVGVLYHTNNDYDFCTLTDFINSFEQMQKTNADLHSRLEKIEFHLKHHR